MKIVDVYGTDITKIVMEVKRQRYVRKDVNAKRYERRYYRIAEERARLRWTDMKIPMIDTSNITDYKGMKFIPTRLYDEPSPLL